MIRLSLIFIFSFITLQSIFSQQVTRQNWCGSIEAMEANFKKHPELKQRFDAYQASANLEQSNNNNSAQKIAAVNYTIPVVFHVLHQNGTENISDAQIEDEIRILNRDYNLQNADTSVIIAPFVNIKSKVNFTFVLAKLDPNGNCTSGIDRFYDPNTLDWQGNSSDYMYTWDPTKYLNFYVVKVINGGAAGYAYYPGSLYTGSNMDGIVILSQYVGSIGTSSAYKSRAITHEVGHWFNLQHTWGNTNNPGVACGDDQVGDTPETQGFTTCSTLLNSQICNAGISENYQNYMDYSYCSVMFTTGQASRMNNAANNSTAGRNNLGSAGNLASTGITPNIICAPFAKFKANKQLICAAQTITYTDESNVGTPTNWAWIFEGGTPSTSSVQNPTVTYNNPGTYSVQLIASNSGGNSLPEIKTSYINVYQAVSSTSLSDGFETGSIPNNKWLTNNVTIGNTNWIETNLSAATGSKSLYVSETISQSSTVDLYSQPYDISNITNPVVTFKWAGAERDNVSTTADALNFYISTDCGATWTLRWLRSIKATTTGVSGVVNGNFRPTATQFNQETINLSAYASITDLLFRFKFASEIGSSNNFYLDDINLTSTVATTIKEQANSLDNFSVFPNPATDNIIISFDLVDDKKIEVTLIDVLGKTVKTIKKQNLNSGHNELQLSLTDISKGIYFIKTNAVDLITTHKIIVN